MLGWIAGLILAACVLPQSIQSIREGNAEGVNGLFLLSWLVGLILMLFYLVSILAMPLIFTTTLTIVFVSIVTYYKFKPRRSP